MLEPSDTVTSVVLLAELVLGRQHRAPRVGLDYGLEILRLEHLADLDLTVLERRPREPLAVGFSLGSRREASEAELERFVANPAVEVLPVGEDVVDLYAAIVLDLKVAGKPLPANDIWIAWDGYNRRMAWHVALGLLIAAVLLGSAPAGPALTITHKARALQSGELVVLTVVSNTALSTIEVKAFNRTQRAQALPSTSARPHAWIALVGIDLDVQPGTHSVSVSATSPAGTATARHRLAVRAKQFATRRLTVDPNFVDPPESEAARIEKEAAALTAAWQGTAGPNPVPELAFVPPVPHKANSAFGTRSFFNGRPRSAHSGADFPSPAGTPIKAPAPGRVVIADDLYFSGGTVVVDHGLGIVSLFGHMSQILVKVGDDVVLGAELGLVGATGRVTGPHLHWTVRVNGARVDPLSLVALLPGRSGVASAAPISKERESLDRRRENLSYSASRVELTPSVRWPR